MAPVNASHWIGSASRALYPPGSGIVVGRFDGTVVVTVRGDLDGPRAVELDYVLGDLIDGQGNTSVILDVHDATASDPAWLSVFTDAAARAVRRGATLTLDGAPSFLAAALKLHDIEQFRGAGLEGPVQGEG